MWAISGRVALINSTLSGNGAGFDGGGISNSGTVTLTNTIVANSASGGNCSVSGGSLVNGGNNIDSENSCGFTIHDTNPLLGPLANNGGPTQTHALLPGSPAIDAGNDAVCAASPVSGVDQRGVLRPIGAHCDIGAYEAPRFLFLPLIIK